MQLRWPDAEGPDEKVSRHIGCPATQGWTLQQLFLLYMIAGSMHTMIFALISAILAVAVAQQNIKDPTNDFCRRHRQQTCVIDSKLYIDGGMVYYGGSKDNNSIAEQSMLLAAVPTDLH